MILITIKRFIVVVVVLRRRLKWLFFRGLDLKRCFQSCLKSKTPPIFRMCTRKHQKRQPSTRRVNSTSKWQAASSMKPLLLVFFQTGLAHLPHLRHLRVAVGARPFAILAFNLFLYLQYFATRSIFIQF